MPKRKKKPDDTSAQADLTPMIDVTFQLLIFFIVCTRFKQDERNHRADLPLDEGLATSVSVPKEQVSIYCNWDEASQVNDYYVALDARGRKVVDNTRAALQEIVIFPADGTSAISQKKALYRQVFENLVAGVENYIRNSGAKIEKLEIAFSVNNAQGARSGTAPWMYVSLAIDAAALVNKNRTERGEKDLTVTFKFADAMQKYGAK